MANQTFNEEAKKVFCERLKGLIKRTGSTNAELERAMDISQPTFQNVMQGRTAPSVDFVMKMADFFGVSVDYLLGRCETEGRQGDYDFEEIRLESYERYLRHRKTEWGVRAALADGYQAPWPYNLAEEILGEEFPCIMTKDQMEGLREASKHLTEREQEYIWLYYRCGYTLEDIGKKYDVTKQWVRLNIARGVRKMQQPRLRDMVRYGYSGSLMRGENKRLEDENRWLEERNKTLRERIEENLRDAEKKSQELEEQVGAVVVEVPNLDISIDELDLSVRSYNCLHRAGCYTVEDIVKYCKNPDKNGLLGIRNMGKRSAEEVAKRLQSFGIDISAIDAEREKKQADRRFA